MNIKCMHNMHDIIHFETSQIEKCSGYVIIIIINYYYNNYSCYRIL